jgi:hypothetical protein
MEQDSCGLVHTSYVTWLRVTAKAARHSAYKTHIYKFLHDIITAIPQLGYEVHAEFIDLDSRKIGCLLHCVQAPWIGELVED